ncbi:MAG: AAA family ATPase [Oscillospiraceae bacterium]
MEFEQAMIQAQKYLSFDERFLSPDLPQGLWFCDNLIEVSTVQLNAVCLGSACSWEDIAKCQEFFAVFPYIVIVCPNETKREEMREQLRPRLPTCCIYEVQTPGFRNCATMQEYIDLYGLPNLPAILEGAVELPAYGLVNLAAVKRRDLSKISRVLSGFPVLDRGICGFVQGELSVWTGRRGAGKSTLLGQILLESINQGHTVCAYSGELEKEQFRQWIYLQAAGPEHIVYQVDGPTGKRLAEADAIADRQISKWMNERFWLFDLEANASHDTRSILSQFEYAYMRYGADVFLVDNIMSIGFQSAREADYYRTQSDFVRQLVSFAKKHKAHVHLVAHPRKGGGKGNGGDSIGNDDVGGTGDITNRADNVFSLSRQPRDVGGEIEQLPVLTVLKNRDFGMTGSIYLDFDKASRRFFPAKTGTPKKPFGWDPAARQLSFAEITDEPGVPFPANSKEVLPCK